MQVKSTLDIAKYTFDSLKMHLSGSMQELTDKVDRVSKIMPDDAQIIYIVMHQQERNKE